MEKNIATTMMGLYFGLGLGGMEKKKETTIMGYMNNNLYSLKGDI